MTDEEKNRILNASPDDLVKMAISLTEDNEKLQVRMSGVTKNAFDLSDPARCHALAKELRQAAREADHIGCWKEGCSTRTPTDKHLGKFIIID